MDAVVRIVFHLSTRVWLSLIVMVTDHLISELCNIVSMVS